MKENGHNDLDTLLKEQLGDRQAGVPEFVWERIEERIYPEKKRRGLFWWWFFGVGLLMVGVTVWMVVGKSGRDANPPVVENEGVKDVSGRSYLTTHDAGESTTSEPLRDISGSQKGKKTRDDYAHALHLLVNQKKNTHSTYELVTRDISETENTKSKVDNYPERVLSKGSGRSTTPLTNDLVTRDISGSPKGRNKENGSTLMDKNPNLSQNSPANETLPRNRANLQAFSSTRTSVGKRHIPFTNRLPKALDPDALPPKSPALSGNPDTPGQLPPPPKELSRFSILAYGGPSFYSMTAIKPYFITGQLSPRTFAASGFEAGLGTSFRLSDRFSVYALGTFNRKQASQTYSFVISEEQYFNQVLQGEQVPLETISDYDNENCFLAENATAAYTVTTWSAAVGGTFTVLRLGKWSLDTDLRFSINAASQLKVMETTVVSIAEPKAEHFSWYQPGAGLTVRYQLNRRISIGIAPLYSHRFHRDDNSFSKKLNEVIVPVTVGIGI